jgi:uroporphyrinogen-III synthase
VTRRLLILRPEPGASETAARARELGLEPVVAPLFEVRPLDWEPPEPGAYDAVLLTSANAARHGGPALKPLLTLPCWTVGEATAAAARAVGFADVRTGPGDGGALAEAALKAGVRRALHLHGRDHVPLSRRGLAVEGRAVYAAEAVSSLPAAANLPGEVVALIHSSRAGALFASLSPRREKVALAAISPAAAAAAGSGWADVAVAPEPRGEALLELAAKLCNNRQPGRTGAGGSNGL